jgi:two-component system, OmpR family, sensor histidine kinase BaeS
VSVTRGTERPGPQLQTAGLVHEMRNQLAIVRANLEAFLEGKLAPTPARLQAILQAVAQLDALIDDLRTDRATQAFESRPTVIDVCELLQREFRAIEAVAIAKKIAVQIHACPHVDARCREFSGDPLRIGQIVKNVLINAVRYTPDGGSITINCARRPDHLEITVADSGPGVAAQEFERIFRPGERGAAASASGVQGSGFGLAIVKELVAQEGGNVRVSSSTPHGARFVIELPGTLHGV